MKKADRIELSPIVRRFIGDAGNATQSFGLGRALGQIYAFLYFSPEPRSLGAMQEALGISKGGASTNVRQLEQWGAVRKVWIKGDRKDYYEANDWFGRILKNAVLDTVGKKISAYTALLDEVDKQFEEGGGDGDAFVKDRIGHLREFHDRAQSVWSSKLLQKLLK